MDGEETADPEIPDLVHLLFNICKTLVTGLLRDLSRFILSQIILFTSEDRVLLDPEKDRHLALADHFPCLRSIGTDTEPAFSGTAALGIDIVLHAVDILYLLADCFHIIRGTALIGRQCVHQLPQCLVVDTLLDHHALTGKQGAFQPFVISLLVVGGEGRRPVVEVRVTRSIVSRCSVYHHPPDIMDASGTVNITAVAQCVLDPQGREIGFCKHRLSGSQIVIQVGMCVGISGHLVSHRGTGHGICGAHDIAVFIRDEDIGIRFRERIGSHCPFHEEGASVHSCSVQLQPGTICCQILPGCKGTECEGVIALLLQSPPYGVCQCRISLYPGAVRRQIIAVLIIQDVFSESGRLKEEPGGISAVRAVRHITSVFDRYIVSRRF